MTGSENSQHFDSAGSVQEVVDRWTAFGGTWQVEFAHAESETATVTLARCDGGEAVDVLTVTDPGDLAWLHSEAR